ncbi:transposase [Paenibacillus amylolyticus]|nr:transposase [Paenibacillus amylolyticus]
MRSTQVQTSPNSGKSSTLTAKKLEKAVQQLEHLEKTLGKRPKTVIANAEYRSGRNYSYFEDQHIQAIVKYGTYHKEKTRAFQQAIGKVDNWSFNETEDTWTCAAGKTLHFRYESETVTESGYPVRTRHYRSEDCGTCPLKATCTKAKGNREIMISLTYMRQKTRCGNDCAARKDTPFPFGA